jgi:hypothetical protein
MTSRIRKRGVHCWIRDDASATVSTNSMTPGDRCKYYQIFLMYT